MKIKVPGCMAVTMDDRRWFAVRVKGGASDAVFTELQDAGYDAYLPRSRFDRFNRRLRVLSEWSEPLLPGYLFVVHPRKSQPFDDWTEVRAVKGVVGPLGSDVGPLLIPSAVVEAIMNAEFEGVYDETKAAKKVRGESERQKLEQRFEPGRRFVVEDGPFASFVAEVDQLTHDDRVKALVSIFGRLTPVTFDPDQLKDTAGPKVA